MADSQLQQRSQLRSILDLPRPILFLVLAFVETYVLFSYFPEHVDGLSLRGLMFRLYAVQVSIQLFWGLYLYPEFFSPLRGLPRVKGLFSADRILFESPRGLSCLKWMKEIPNTGLIRTRGMDGVECLLITSPQVYSEVLVHRSYDFVKPFLVRKFLSRIVGWGLIAAEGEMHRAQRKSLMPAFQLKNIRDLYPLMWNKCMLFTEMLTTEIYSNPASSTSDGQHTGNVEISGWASRLTIDIIGPAAMGRDFRSLQDNDNVVANNYLELFQPNLRRLLYFGFVLIAPPWLSENWPSPANTAIKRTVKEIREVCLDTIREKKRELAAESVKNEPNDILSIMLRGRDMDDPVCVDQMLTFLAAGHETTANALSWACYELCKKQHYQTALREELRSAMTDPHRLNISSELDSLPLLNGICNEVLRLYPTVPITVRAPIRDTELAGQKIPECAWLILCPWATNRDPTLWGEDADMFRPERWIDELVDERTAAHEKESGATIKRRLNAHGGSTTNYALMTFLHGPRSCIGQTFAKAELRCAVAALVGRFALRLQRPDEEVASVGAIATKPRNGMHLKMSILPGWCAVPDGSVEAV